MHPAVLDWVRRWVPACDPMSVLDVGGRDINGNPWGHLHRDCHIEVVDLVEAPSVTWVGDFLTYPSSNGFDLVLHLEVAEHTPDWRQHLRHVASLLDADGLFVFTAAGPARAPHSAIDGGPLREGEHYENVHPDTLSGVLDALYEDYVVDVTSDSADVRAVAWR